MIAFDRLVALALGDSDDDEAAKVEEHVLSCAACAMTLERLVRLGDGARDLIRSGGVAFPVTRSLLERLRREGLVSRWYRVTKEAVVPCTVSAADIYSMTTLEADLAGVTRAALVVTLPAGEPIRMEDVPFDAESGTMSYVVRSSALRRLPSGRVTLELYAVETERRLLGRYYLEHTAFSGA